MMRVSPLRRLLPSTISLAAIAAVLVLLQSIAEPALAAKRVALVVGNARYENVSALANPRNDAAAITRALEAIGFDEVRHLDDLDHQSMLRALKDFTGLAAGAETALVYYAGHGVEVDGRNYLVPVDASLVQATDVEFEAVLLDNVRTAVSGATKLRIVILDACRNNPFKLASADKKRTVGRRGLAGIESGSNELIAYAAKEGTLASDGTGATNSPYAAALARHLAEPGLEIRLLFGRVRDEVMQSTGSAQEPYVYGSLGGEALYLNSQRPIAVEPRGDGAPDPPLTEEARVWPTIERTQSCGVLDDFIRHFEPGGSVFVDFARTRWKELSCGEQKVTVATPPPSPEPAGCDDLLVRVDSGKRCLKPGDEFRDCADCPEMVVVPAGRFTMGSPAGEEGRSADEGPQQEVTIAKPFVVGKFEVTFDEWDACVRGGDCVSVNDIGWGRGRRPVINVSWENAKTYLAWLGKRTGQPYRLLSEAEWEYAARAGTTTRYSCGEGIGRGNATCVGCDSEWDNKQTAPVGSFKSNGFGLHDMHGNVWERVEDCYHFSYSGAPTDGSTWDTACIDDGRRVVVRGGSWSNTPPVLRSAYRSWLASHTRPSSIGFRLARTLDPSGDPGGQGYMVQVRATISHMDALGSFADMQQHYSDLLASSQPDIQKFAKGDQTWYRLRIGPPASKQAASTLCSKLKAAGLKECIVTRY